MVLSARGGVPSGSGPVRGLFGQAELAKPRRLRRFRTLRDCALVQGFCVR